MKSSRTPYFAIGVVVTMLVVLGFVASPVEQPQQVATLVDRVNALETAVADQEAIHAELDVRLAALEAAIGIGNGVSVPVPPPPSGIDTSDWLTDTSSDGQITYRYDPDWVLDEDEPGSLGFVLPDTGQFIFYSWDFPPDMVSELRNDNALFEEFQAEIFGSDEQAEVLSFEEVRVAGEEALAWEVAGTTEDGFSLRGWMAFYDCSAMASCVLVLMHIGVDNPFTDRARQLLDAFAQHVSFASGAVADRNANLRSCPSTSCSILGVALQGQPLDLVAQNADGTWYKLESGEWIAALLVDNAPANLPVIESSTDL